MREPLHPGSEKTSSLFARLCYVVISPSTFLVSSSSFAMLVVHPASLCDVCLDPYIISSEPANSPHVIACGHIFCLTWVHPCSTQRIAPNTPCSVRRCLRNLSPSACPLCRKLFESGRVKKLHVAAPPELGDPTEETIEAEATELLQRVALVSGEDVPEVEIVEVVTLVQEWLSNKSTDDDSVSIIVFSCSRARSPCSSCRWDVGHRAVLAGGSTSVDPSCSALSCHLLTYPTS